MNVWINACQNKALISQFHLIQYCDHHCARCLRIQVYSCNVNYVAFVPVLNCLSSGPVASAARTGRVSVIFFLKRKQRVRLAKDVRWVLFLFFFKPYSAFTCSSHTPSPQCSGTPVSIKDLQAVGNSCIPLHFPLVGHSWMDVECQNLWIASSSALCRCSHCNSDIFL